MTNLSPMRKPPHHAGNGKEHREEVERESHRTVYQTAATQLTQNTERILNVYTYLLQMKEAVSVDFQINRAKIWSRGQ